LKTLYDLKYPQDILGRAGDSENKTTIPIILLNANCALQNKKDKGTGSTTKHLLP